MEKYLLEIRGEMFGIVDNLASIIHDDIPKTVSYTHLTLPTKA